MSFEYGYEVTVERPTGFNDDGVPTAPATHIIRNCVQGQLQSVETVDGTQVVVASEKVFCDDIDADVQDTDVLILPGGERWQVNGRVYRPRNPFSDFHGGCVIPVERASGSTPPQPGATPPTPPEE